MSDDQPCGETASLLRRVFTSWTLYLVVGLVLVGWLLARWVSQMGGPEVFREKFGLVAPLVTVPVHVVITVTPFPSDVISVANGTLYGFWLGASLNWIGWWLAALAEYGLGRRAGRDFEVEDHLAAAPRWLRRFPVQHPLFLIGSRQVPWAGGHISTFVPGVMGVSLRRFAWCSAVAIVPSSLLMAAIGVGLLQL
jgi:uncharacterized membrane protein YdjX (TVP38/TMEM64 family)